MNILLKAITARLLIATLAVVVITFAGFNSDTQRATVIGGFLVLGVLPNLILQWHLNRKHFSAEKLDSKLTKAKKSDSENRKDLSAIRLAKNSKASLDQLPPNQKSALISMEISYVFWFSLLALIAGSQLLQNLNYMYLAMAYAIYHGLNLFVIKYFHNVAVKSGEITFWTTVLTNLNPIYAFGYLILTLFLWREIEKPKFDILAFNYSLAIGLFAGLLTWIS